MTARHQSLIDEFAAAASDAWSDLALLSCLRRLAVSTVTEAWAVRVIDAGVYDDWSFWVCYEYRYFSGRLGLRADARDPHHPGHFRDQYDDDRDLPSDPVQTGADIADFDIGEPLGSVAERLQADDTGIHWWGWAQPVSQSAGSSATGRKPVESPIELTKVDEPFPGAISARWAGDPGLTHFTGIADAMMSALARSVDLVIPADVAERLGQDLPPELPDWIRVQPRA